MAIEVCIEKAFGKAFRLAADLRSVGGCLGLLGASGSGKSMILKCIAGLEIPDRGRIAVNGRVLFDSDAGVCLRPQQRRVGYLFQNYALFPNMTAAKNIGIGITRPAAERDGIVRGLLHRFRLEGMENRYPHQLSGGQQQRAALARMLAAEPDVILLDEPFSALDAHLREQMQLRLAEVISGCGDAILVTHSRDEAYRLCSDTAVIDGGRILGSGPTRQLFANPGNLTVAQVTGCKNISRLRKIDETTAEALDWGIRLRTAAPVPDDAGWVGIRAHDIEPLSGNGNPEEDNTVLMNIVSRAEDMFEWNVIFTNACRPDAAGEIWWKYSKYALETFPSRLRFPPEALLFLRG